MGAKRTWIRRLTTPSARRVIAPNRRREYLSPHKVNGLLMPLSLDRRKQWIVGGRRGERAKSTPKRSFGSRPRPPLNHLNPFTSGTTVFAKSSR